jgi:hypothetical protein
MTPVPKRIKIDRATLSGVSVKMRRWKSPTFQHIFGGPETARRAGPTLGLPLSAISDPWAESARVSQLTKAPHEDGS